MNRMAPFFNRPATRRQRPGAAVQCQHTADGRSELPGRVAPPAPPPAFVVFLKRTAAILAAVVLALPLAALGALAFLAGAIVAIVCGLAACVAKTCSQHGPDCDCAFFACADCGEPPAKCNCQPGSE